jgi:hypothetical protein
LNLKILNLFQKNSKLLCFLFSYSSDRLSGCQLSDFDHDFQEPILKEESTDKKKDAKEEEKERLIEACTIYQDDWER